MKKIAVIGGGASGLVAAIAAARSNPKVQITIYEQKDSVGKKILATGNGRCNLTNKDMKSSYYRSENIPFVEEVLEQFGYEDTIRFFSSLGLMVKERGNYVYPHSDQASTVLELLKLELHRLGIKILTGNGYYPDIVRLYDKAKYRKTESGCCNSGLWWKGKFKTGI